MTSNSRNILLEGAYEEGEECSFCSGTKPGVAVEMDGAKALLCWPCLKKFVRLRANTRPKEEPATPTFPAMASGNGD